MERMRPHTLRRGWLSALLGGVCVAGCTCAPDAPEPLESAARIRQIREVARQDTEGSAGVLAKAVAHEDLATSIEAVRGLGRLRRPAAAQTLVRTARKDARPDVRVEALVAMGYRDEPESLEALRGAVREDPAPAVRGAAATAIGRAGALSVVDLLLTVAEADVDAMVQGRAVGAIERLVRLDFGYDTAATPEERRQRLKVVRAIATQAVAGLQALEARKGSS